MIAGLIAARFLHFAALTLLFGALLFPAYAYTREERRTAGAVADLPRPWLVSAAVLILLSGLAWFDFTAAEMAGDIRAALDPATLMQALTQTDFGRLWTVRIGLALALIVLLVRRKGPALRSASLLLAALLLGLLAGTGHARMDQGARGVLHVACDAVHLLTAGVWLGGLVPLAMTIRRTRPGGTSERQAAHLILTRFSAVAVAVVALLLLTGIANAALMLGSVWDLPRTAYGRLLLLKLLCVSVMLALAAINRQKLTPALAGLGETSDGALRLLRRHVLLEQMLGAAVLLVVAVLGVLPPPT